MTLPSSIRVTCMCLLLMRFSYREYDSSLPLTTRYLMLLSHYMIVSLSMQCYSIIQALHTSCYMDCKQLLEYQSLDYQQYLSYTDLHYNKYMSGCCVSDRLERFVRWDTTVLPKCSWYTTETVIGWNGLRFIVKY